MTVVHSNEEQVFLDNLDKKLWNAADRLRSNLDAAVYKHAVLGLIFLKYVSDSFDLRRYLIQHKNDYYRLLLEVSEQQAWEPWVVYMLKGIEETATATRKMVQAIRALLESTVEKVRVDLPKIYSKELVELLFHQPYTKIAFLVDAGIAKRQTAATYLQSLEDIGVLTSETVGRERLFINTALLDLLTKGNP